MSGLRASLETLVITRLDIAAIVEVVGRDRLMDETIAALDRAFATLDADAPHIPVRDGFVVGAARQGVLEWMPIHRGDEALVKLVGYNPDNPALRGLPTIIATLLRFDVETGHLAAVADGVVATALRTGAASALASRVLARRDSSIVALVGCGAQAATQLHALSRLFSIDRVLVHDIDPDVERSFPRRAAFLGLDVRVAPLARLEREADILCTATSVAIGRGPVIEGTSLRPWIHINAVGSDLPGKTELPRELLERSLVCPDYLPQAVREGECQQLPHDRIGPSLCEILQRPEQVDSWRERSTVFDSTGFALEDQAVMEVLLRHARALGLGTLLPIEYLAEDPKNPYSRPADRAREAAGAADPRSDGAADPRSDGAGDSPCDGAGDSPCDGAGDSPCDGATDPPSDGPAHPSADGPAHPPSGRPPPQRPGPEPSFPRFLFLWLSQSVSMFGSAMAFFAATSWLAMIEYPRAEDRQQLGGAIAALMLALAVPRIVVAPIAGVWADRCDRRRVMMAMDAGCAAASAALCVLALSERLDLARLIALIAITRVLTTFHSAALDASYVMVVPESQLPRAHGLNQTSWSVANVLAPLLGALLGGLPAFARAHGWDGAAGSLLGRLAHGWGIAFAFDAISFALAALALVFLAIPSPAVRSAGDARSMWSDVLVGVRFLRARPALVWLVAIGAATSLLTATEGVLVPLLVKLNLGADLAERGMTFDQGYATVIAAASAGGIAGGMIITSWGGLKRRRMYGVLVPLALIGLLQVGYGLATGLAMAAVMAFAKEQATPALNAHDHTLWQTVTPPELQGRVFAVRDAAYAGTAALAMPLAGFLAGWIDPGWLFALAGAALFAVGVSQLASPYRLVLESRTAPLAEERVA